jgi:hypothetical protein
MKLRRAQIGTDQNEHLINKHGYTVDGRNPAPVDRWFIPLFLGFQPSKMVQDFYKFLPSTVSKGTTVLSHG